MTADLPGRRDLPELCPDCSGTRCVPMGWDDPAADNGYVPCPTCPSLAPAMPASVTGEERAQQLALCPAPDAYGTADLFGGAP